MFIRETNLWPQLLARRLPPLDETWQGVFLGGDPDQVWGGAADLFIDENPRDGIMDDLNGDGRIDQQDARILYDIIEEIDGNAAHSNLVGGLAQYKRNSAHGPFVHLDTRGFVARWGN